MDGNKLGTLTTRRKPLQEVEWPSNSAVSVLEEAQKRRGHRQEAECAKDSDGSGSKYRSVRVTTSAKTANRSG